MTRNRRNIGITKLYPIARGVQSFIKGDYPEAAVSAVQALSSSKKEVPFGAMARGRPRRRVVRRRRGRRPSRYTRLTVKRSISFDATWGTDHRWYYPIRLSLLEQALNQTFDEFKVIRISVRYLPNDPQSETGLLAFVLLDREGFGAYGSSTGKAWFPVLSAMPGSRVGPRYRPYTLNWRPTEPSARDWFRHKDNPVLCTAYICNNGSEKTTLGGVFMISATLLARGLYYNAGVSDVLRQHGVTVSDGIAEFAILPSAPQVVEPMSPAPSEVDRMSNHTSSHSICGFDHLNMD